MNRQGWMWLFLLVLMVIATITGTTGESTSARVISGIALVPLVIAAVNLRRGSRIPKS